METRKLRAFLAVAEELHFGRAARRLNMTQPPLSQLIRAMEEELGARLFVRDNRNVSLTEAGRALAEQARLVLDAESRLEEVVRRTVSGQAGKLRAGLIRPALDGALPLAVRRFRERYPLVGLELLEMGTVDQLAALAQDRLDVGVVRLFGALPRALASRLLTREPYVLALPRGHALASRRRLELAELAGQPMIWPPRRSGPALVDHLVERCRLAGFTPVVVQEAAAKQTTLALVAAGLGLAFMPESARRSGREGVVFRPLGPGLPPVEIGCIWRQDRDLATVRNFVAALLEDQPPDPRPERV